MDIDTGTVLTRYEDSGHLARKSLCQELHEAGLRRPDHPAVVAHDARLTHAELERAIARFARGWLRATRCSFSCPTAPPMSRPCSR